MIGNMIVIITKYCWYMIGNVMVYDDGSNYSNMMVNDREYVYNGCGASG